MSKYVPRPRRDWRDRFLDKVAIGGAFDCWIWKGALSKNGYGSFKKDGKPMTTSRLAYLLANGNEAGDLMVLHTCDNRACCNPAHLYLGDVKQNTRDMMERGRHRTGPVRGEHNGNAKLTEDAVRQIKVMIRDGKRNQDIAPLFGVTHQMISKIRNGHFWQHVGIEKGEAA